jgi:hypothetical protein
MSRLSFLLLFAVFSGCGDANNNSGTPDLSMAAQPDLTSSMPGGCGAEGAACSSGSGNGLCRGGTCSPCTDTVDDAACGAAYSGTLCTQGSCIAGCHDSSTCSGKICDPDTSQCRSCTQDADCPAAQFCDLATGKCGATPPACTAGVTAECCGNGDCTGAGATCDNGSCIVATNCTDARTPGQVYVNADAMPGFVGKGTMQCPFKNIGSGIAAAPSPAPAPFKVCVKGIFDKNNVKNWPINVRTNITLDGTYCGGTTHSVIKAPAATNPIIFSQVGPAGIHGFDLTSENPTGMKTGSGIYISDTGQNDPININDVNISNFGRGITVTKGPMSTKVGYAGIHHDTHVTGNGVGLSIDNGGHAVVSVASMMESATRAEFNMNDGDGINIGNGTLEVEGQAFTGMGAGPNECTVRANLNGNDGLHVTSNKSTVSLKYFSGTNNSINGLDTLNTATVSARHSVFNNNMFHGIHVFQTANTTNSVSTLDFGKDATANAGHNYISGNKTAGICIATGATPPDPFQAQGDQFGPMKDCSMGSAPANKVTVAEQCDRALDVAGQGGGSASGTLVQVKNCDILSCFQVSGTGGCPQ